MNYKTSKIGSFEVKSGRVIVTDPCYDLGTRGMIELIDVKNGPWVAAIGVSDCGDWGDRVAVFNACHKDWSNSELHHSFIGTIGVDSGQAGVFDLKFYKDDNSVNGLDRLYNKEAIAKDEPFYSFCCDRTLSEKRAGVIPYGAISRSGFGDGEYEVRVALDENGGKVIGIQIVFIDENEGDNEEHNDEED